MIIFKQCNTVQNVHFSYLEAGDIGYLSFQISEDSELEKWPNENSKIENNIFINTQLISDF